MREGPQFLAAGERQHVVVIVETAVGNEAAQDFRRVPVECPQDIRVEGHDAVRTLIGSQDVDRLERQALVAIPMGLDFDHQRHAACHL